MWKDSTGTVWVHGAIEIKNTGRVPIKVGDIAISFVDKEGQVLGSCVTNLPVPEILKPGEIAYAGDSKPLEGVKSAEAVVRIEANIDFDQTNKEEQLLEVKQLNIFPQQFGGPKVTGKVVNTSNKNADDIRIAVAMFDEGGNLLGVYRASPGVTLAPSKEMGFEVSYPPIEVKDFHKKVKTLAAKAFNWTWD